jgi:hypothetical protein
MSTDGVGTVRALEPGAVVRVRSEETLSVVVLPTDGPPDCVPEGVPDVGVCCVPIALVSTPVNDGELRWVQISDLTRVDPAEISADPDGPAGGLSP